MRIAWVAAALIGCGEDVVLPVDTAVSAPVALVQAEAWTRLDDARDPFADERPDDASCLATSTGVEAGGLEIVTDGCGWVTLSQPLLAPLAAGDVLEVVAWHGTLAAPEPAEALWTLHVDGVLLWERAVAIPGAAAAYDDAVTSPIDAPAGAEVLLHLRNHGANTYRFQELSRAGEVEE